MPLEWRMHGASQGIVTRLILLPDQHAVGTVDWPNSQETIYHAKPRGKGYNHDRAFFLVAISSKVQFEQDAQDLLEALLPLFAPLGFLNRFPSP